MNRFEKMCKEKPIEFWVELIRRHCHFIGCEFCVYNSYKKEGFDESEDYVECSVCYDDSFETDDDKDLTYYCKDGIRKWLEEEI